MIFQKTDWKNVVGGLDENRNLYFEEKDFWNKEQKQVTFVFFF